MLTSIAIIILLGLLVGWIFSKLRLPGLLGMIIVGIILSPYALNLIDDSILMISGNLRQIALVIILTRAGLSLDISDLKKVGRPAILMCFVPACIEISGTVILAPILLKVSVLDAAIIGSVIAAVSPAVVVPRMIRLIDEGYGKNKSIPQLILAGASVDDVFVIVIFTAFTALASTGEISASRFIQIPISIILGIILGSGAGILLVLFFKKNHMRDTVKILIILSISFLLLEVQNRLEGYIPISGLLAIMSMGIMLKQKYDMLAARLSAKYNKLWLGAEIFLFVLVGATVDLKYVESAGIFAVMLIIGALLFRMIGVALSLVKTNLSKRERLFCMLAYTPKATVQAAIGAIPLTMGLDCGNIVLTVAVLSILITAPFGAICVDNLYKRLLAK
ncbi:cation:proton antiporter [Lacrimispora sp. 210928-DFI.3.58]|uniref:cation:proton antiporter n=1 Tax=Lacrimispora sp. 210928-DFI.3.58 TaxID=2883214 RepID=UPI001D07992F|nr:cation:proton antiporter [Lacrimispora sp. 210928-DFI.3.58]MCB7321022.1 cation:proton antiporter [Lacrimispora sp. 210928-DFI.3.58]